MKKNPEKSIVTQIELFPLMMIFVVDFLYILFLRSFMLGIIFL